MKLLQRDRSFQLIQLYTNLSDWFSVCLATICQMYVLCSVEWKDSL